MSIKDVRSQGEKGLFSVDKRGFSNAGVRIFWCKQLRIFGNLWYVLTDKVGLISADIF